MKRQEKDNRDNLLKYKKVKFLSAVERVSEYLRFRKPRVVFWPTYDSSHFTVGERAHIHIENNTICIAEPELEIMSEEDIEETASHEVSHLKDLSHSRNFQNIKEDTKAGLWRPPAGESVVAIDGNSKPIVYDKNKKKSKPDKLRCNYHLCRKRTKTFQCKYCENYYCKEHLEPREPNIGYSAENEKNTHPCFAYFRHMENERKEEDKRWGNFLNVATGRRNKEIQYKTKKAEEYKEEQDREERNSQDNENLNNVGLNYLDRVKKERYSNKYEKPTYAERKYAADFREKPEKKEGPNRFWIYIVLVIIFLLIIGGLVFIKQYKFSDEKAVLTQGKNLSNYAFSQINSFRESNNISKLVESKAAYDLALFLSKERTDNRKYETEAEKNKVLIDYGFGKDTIIFSGILENVSKKDIDYLVFRWKELSATNEVLLNRSYTQGSMACYKTACFFISVNQNYIEPPKNVSKTFTPIWNKISSKTKTLLQKFSLTGVGTIFAYIILGIMVVLFGLGTIIPTSGKTKIISWILLLVLFFTLGPWATGVVGGDNPLNSYEPFNSISTAINNNVDIPTLEQKVHELINIERQNNGIRTLSFDDKLSDIARMHSQDMAANNFFSHDNLNGQDPTARATALGYKCFKDYGAYYTEGIAENIAQTPQGNVIGCGNVYTVDEIAKCAVSGWMSSPGHRQNILTTTYDKEGIGIAQSGSTFYLTQDFC